MPEGTSESLATYGKVEALAGGMQVCTSPGCDGCWIRQDRLCVRARADGHPQQLAFGGSPSTPDARADRRVPGLCRDVLVNHRW